MTKDLKEKKTEDDSLQKENQTLRSQLSIMQDLQNLQNTTYYRQQILMMLERQALAMEMLARNSEIPSSEEDEKDEEDEEE